MKDLKIMQNNFNLKDQHGNSIPQDLVFIQIQPEERIDHYDLHRIMNANWYELLVNGNSILCASKTEVNGAKEDFVFKFIQEDELETINIKVINDAMKKFNVIEGFYIQ